MPVSPFALCIIAIVVLGALGLPIGHSMIVAPTGEIAAKTQSEEDEVICFNCDIDLAANLKKTMFNFAAHRRPEHYKLILERVGAEVTPASTPE